MTADEILAASARDLGTWLADVATTEDIKSITDYKARRRIDRVIARAEAAVYQRGWGDPVRHAAGQFTGETFDSAFRAELRRANDYIAPVNAGDPPWVE